MLGTGLNFGRARGEDRFYDPAKARRTHQNRQSEQLRRAQSDVSAGHSPSPSSANRVPENRAGSGKVAKPVIVPAFDQVVAPRPSNLERFLQAITPFVPAQYPSKTTTRGFGTCDVKFQPYFVLGDLWESFKEWSAYGAGVPLILNDTDSVVQYYVPYLSGMQIYVESKKSSTRSRQPGEYSDSEFRDSSSDGSSDCEPERGLQYVQDQWSHRHPSTEVLLPMDTLSLRDDHTAFHEGFSSDEGESVNSQGCLHFEYLERDLPYSREPLADKLADLARRFPELKTLRSCDVLSSSWISVAWYPIYRIPTGPTLKDLDACFLTYHRLYIPVGGPLAARASGLSCPGEIDGVPREPLPVFGLASYKFKGSLWTPKGGSERQLANSLLQAADNWLRMLRVNHPDFMFFSRR